VVSREFHGKRYCNEPKHQQDRNIDGGDIRSCCECSSRGAFENDRGGIPADLPELARGRGEAMYLHRTSAAQAILYIQRDQGRKLAILDVTDPAKIRAVGQVFD
jgi:hypothetical protein